MLERTVGIEPTTNALEGRDSTAELSARIEMDGPVPNPGMQVGTNSCDSVRHRPSALSHVSPRIGFRIPSIAVRPDRNRTGVSVLRAVLSSWTTSFTAMDATTCKEPPNLYRCPTRSVAFRASIPSPWMGEPAVCAWRKGCGCLSASLKPAPASVTRPQRGWFEIPGPRSSWTHGLVWRGAGYWDGHHRWLGGAHDSGRSELRDLALPIHRQP